MISCYFRKSAKLFGNYCYYYLKIFRLFINQCAADQRTADEVLLLLSDIYSSYKNQNNERISVRVDPLETLMIL